MSVFIAIGSGVAGALSLTTGLSAALVGVMIAVVLIPPASTAGIGISLGDPRVTLGATVLLLVNVFSINLAGTLTLRYQGYMPSGFFERLRTRRSLVWRVGLMVILLGALSVALGVVSYYTYSDATMERNVREALTSEGSAVHEAEGVRLQSFSVNYEPSSFGFGKEPAEVVVRLRVKGEPPPELFERVASEVRAVMGREIKVVVEPVKVVVVE